MDVILRETVVTDADDLARTCWPDTDAAIVQARIDTTCRWMRRGRACGLTALSDGQAIGFGQIVFWRERGEISDLVVAEQHRGSGIGTALIEALVQKGRSMRLSWIEIGVTEDNTAAARLYVSLGFSEQGSPVVADAEGTIHYLRMNLDQDA